MKKALIIIALLSLAVGLQGQGWNYMSTDRESIAFSVSVSGQTDSTCSLTFQWAHDGLRTDKFQLYVMAPGSDIATIQTISDSLGKDLRAYTVEWPALGQLVRFGIRSVNAHGYSIWVCVEETMDDKRLPNPPTNFQIFKGC